MIRQSLCNLKPTSLADFQAASNWDSSLGLPQLECQSRSALDDTENILSAGKLRMAPEGLEDNVPETTVVVNGRAVNFLDGIGKLWRVVVASHGQLEFAFCEILECRNVVLFGQRVNTSVGEEV